MGSQLTQHLFSGTPWSPQGPANYAPWELFRAMQGPVPGPRPAMPVIPPQALPGPAAQPQRHAVPEVGRRQAQALAPPQAYTLSGWRTPGHKVLPSDYDGMNVEALLRYGVMPASAGQDMGGALQNASAKKPGMLNQAKPGSSPASIGQAAIQRAYEQHPELWQGLPLDLTMAIAKQESSFNPAAKVKRSSATGLFQFTEPTWKEMVSRYGERYGIEGDQRTDPMANTLMAGHYLQDGRQQLQSALGRAPTRGEVYMAHYFGPTGALNVASAAPDDLIDNVLGDAAMRANPWLRGKTVAEVRADLERKMRA